MNKNSLSKRWIAFFWFSILAISLSAQALQLTGRVYDLNGSPIRGAMISIFNQNDQLLQDYSSNSLGEFVSTPVYRANQVIRIEINATGYETYTRSLTLKTGKFGTINLTPLYKIMGTLKSERNDPLGQVEVVFFDPVQNRVLGTSFSDSDGNYQSKPLFKRGQKILVKCKKMGYSPIEQNTEIRGAGETVLNLTMETRLYVVGFVLDSISMKAVPDAEIFFYKPEGPLFKTIRTNSSGYYEFDTPYHQIGDIIKVRVEGPKQNGNDIWVPLEKNLRIVKPGLENRIDITIPKYKDRGLKTGLRIYDPKGKPLEGVTVLFHDTEDRQLTTPANGQVTMPVFGSLGELIELRLTKERYKEVKKPIVLSKDFRYFDFYMEKEASKCNCWLYAAAGLAGISISQYPFYKSNYNDYLDLQNLNREKDYNQASTHLRITTISGGLALASFTTWLLCKAKERNPSPIKKQKQESYSMPSLFAGTTSGNALGVGLKYKF